VHNMGLEQVVLNQPWSELSVGGTAGWGVQGRGARKVCLLGVRITSGVVLDFMS
jgi:hypothetical protein